MRKVVLVTGANKGIGFEAVKLFLRNQPKWTVILASRNPERGEEAIKKIKAEGLGSPILCKLNVTCWQEMREAAAWVKLMYGRLDCLVINAGVKADTNVDLGPRARDCFETNYYGVKRSYQGFKDMMAPEGRIVVVGSVAGKMSFNELSAEHREILMRTDLTVKEIDDLASDYLKANDDNQVEQRGWKTYYSSYGGSKVFVWALTRAFAHEQKGKLVVSVCCPGWCKTDMGGESAPRSAAQGAEVVYYCATTDNNIHGSFVSDNNVQEWY